MERFCDLHIHSNYSDGTCSPEELIACAREAGLAAVALTDHNTVLGLPRFLAAARNSGIEAVPGAEFSTDYKGTELHILGLFIRPEHYDALIEMMEQAHRCKEESNRQLVEALAQAGYRLDYERLKASSPSGLINRAHIAGELTRLGYTADRQDAFSKLLSPKCGFYRPPERIDAFEMLRVLKSMGAVTVLAHPFLSLKEENDLREFLAQACEAGLDAMEVRYSKFDEDQTRLAEQLAAQYGLLSSGGSDFHGENKPDILMGRGKGDLKVPVSFLDELKRRAAMA